MAAEPLTRTNRLLAIASRVFRIVRRLLSTQITRVVKRLAEEHVRQAQAEAEAELRRIAIGLGLFFVAGIFTLCTFLMLNVTVVMAFHDIARLPWVVSGGAAALLDLIILTGLATAGWFMARPPYLPQTRASLQRTLEMFKEE